jgi:hypothetical protein
VVKRTDQAFADSQRRERYLAPTPLPSHSPNDTPSHQPIPRTTTVALDPFLNLLIPLAV